MLASEKRDANFDYTSEISVKTQYSDPDDAIDSTKYAVEENFRLLPQRLRFLLSRQFCDNPTWKFEDFLDA